MVTLQLKDICGYIPYGLVVDTPDGLVTAKGIDTIDNIFGFAYWKDGKREISFSVDCKPILYPTDYLYKPITHNGEEIIPIVELAKIGMQDAIRKEYWKPEDFVLVGDKVKLGNYTFFYEKRECFSWSYKYSDLNDQTALYQLQILDLIYELKIDIRGLIPQGLAVSVDELEVNPYK